MTTPPPGNPPAGSPTTPMPAQPPPHGAQPYPGPPPGYHQGPPSQYGPGGAPQAPHRPMPRGHLTVLVLAGISVLGIVLGLSLKENGANAWDTVDAWGGLAVAGAVVTVAPVLGHSVGLTGSRAWQVAACGAAALVLFWVLFVLPAVGSNPNTTLLATIGVIAGLVAVWMAPGRPETAGAGRTEAGPGHTW